MNVRGALQAPWQYPAAFLLIAAAPVAAQPTAQGLIRAAIEAQGGEAQLRAIRTVEWQARGYRNMVEQSERPEGPYIPEFRSVSEAHDLEHGGYRSDIEAAVYPAYQFKSGIVADRNVAMRVQGARTAPGDATAVAIARETLALSPERLLLTALAAGDLRVEHSEVLQSVSQDVLAFTLDDAPVRIYLNRYTHLPTAVDYAGPLAREGFWRSRGDVTMRTYFSFWWLGEGGVRLPMQWDVERNGLRDMSLNIAKLSVNRPLAGDLHIPDPVRARFAQLPAIPADQPLAAGIEAAPGMVVIPGAWYVVLVRQEDGVVVLDAPISSEYSEKILAEAARRFPGVPVKAVVTTSDAWPHLAGIRSYVARGIPVYGLAINAPALKRLIDARFTMQPDALARRPRKPDLRQVSSKTALGRGVNRLELYPIRGEGSERQMMAYLPGLRLLYGSDPFQSDPSGYTSSQAVTELTQAVAREGLAPERFVMMHIPVTPWYDLAKATAPQALKFPS